MRQHDRAADRSGLGRLGRMGRLGRYGAAAAASAVVVCLTGAVAPAQAAVRASAPPVAPETEPTLTTDATGPLFTDAALTPDGPVTACLRLGWTGDERRWIAMSAAVTGDLAAFLEVRVEVGTGGRYADCSGFAGQVVFTGTMARLGADHPDASVPLALLNLDEAVGDGATVRVQVSVQDDDAAQGRGAGASLAFTSLAGSAPDPPADPVRPEPSGGSGPAEPEATAPASPAERPDGTNAVDASTDPSGTAPTGTEPAPEAPPPTVADGPSVVVPMTPLPAPAVTSTWWNSLWQTLFAVGQAFRVAAEPVARGVGWTFWTLPAIVLFLLVQHRIDARDPKLAESPAQTVPSLPFDERYAPTGQIREAAS